MEQQIEQDIETFDRLASEMDLNLAKPLESQHSTDQQIEVAEEPGKMPDETRLSKNQGYTAEQTPDQDALRGKTPILSQTDEILEAVSSSLGLIIYGMQAAIVRSGLNDNSDQLGPLSLIMAGLKQVKNQADSILNMDPRFQAGKDVTTEK